MKKIYILWILGLALMSCSEDFITLAPISSANVHDFYQNADDIEVAVNAAYSYLRSSGQYTSAYYNLAECRSDNTFVEDNGGNLNEMEIDQFYTTSSNGQMYNCWRDNYRGIAICNVLLDRIDGVDMDGNLKNRYIGEAKFLRALMYFNLVRIFGDVPLVVQETKSVEEGYSQGRVATDLVYEQIIADLTDADQKLPSSYTGNDIGRATKGAAKALSGKVYLTVHDYTLAVTKLEEVKDLGIYHLLNNYSDLWDINNENNAESIFEVQYKKGGTGTGSGYNNSFMPISSGTLISKLGAGLGRNRPTDDLFYSYEAGDLRKAASIAEYYIGNTGDTIREKYCLKFRDPAPYDAADADNNWPVLRYADVMLMYAEALNEKNNGPTAEAYNAVNEVRERAGLDPLPDNLSHQQFFSAIEHERQVELAFEGHRWFDLVRTGRMVVIMNAHFAGTSITAEEYEEVFPIPLSEVNVNPDLIKQNEGYD